MPLARRDEQDRLAAATGAAGAADAVNVALGVVGDVVVEDVADSLDVQAARGDVGGDEDVELPSLSWSGALALLLLDVAVDRRRGEAPRPQLLGQLLGPELGAREDDHRLEGLGFEDAGQRVELVRDADDEVALADVGRGGRRGLDGDLDGIL